MELFHYQLILLTCPNYLIANLHNIGKYVTQEGSQVRKY